MFFFGAVSAVVVYGAWRALEYVHVHVGLGAFGHAFVLGAATFARVVVLLIVASLIWVPIGVWIGMDPRVSRLAQPVVQVLASFPANFVFPIAAADSGREFARADIDTSKKLFGHVIAERAPLIKAILRALHATNDGTLREGFFLDLLRRGFSADEARRQLDIAIEWGRYGELFRYDAESGQLILDSDPATVGA